MNKLAVVFGVIGSVSAFASVALFSAMRVGGMVDELNVR